MRVMLLLLFLAGAEPATGAAFDYDAYKPATLSEIANTVTRTPEAATTILDGHPRYRTQAIFTGKIKSTRSSLRNYIRLWVAAMGHPPAYGEVFKQQVQIRQDEITYWMPIQDVLLEPFRKEVVAGSQVELYLLLMGTHKRAPVFAISEFDPVDPKNVTSHP